MPAGVGTVPCNFRLVVHEALQVPPGCRSLSVAWRKGVKEVSTGMAEVVNGDVMWSCNLTISSLLFQGAEADGKAKFEAKFCWLEVIKDGGTVLGHAQLDLAEFCDGRVHERMLQVYKMTGPVGNLRIKVSVEVLGSGLEGAVPLPRPPELPRTAKDDAAQHQMSPRQFPSSPQEAHLQPGNNLSSEDANFADWVRNAANGAQWQPPVLSPMHMNLMPHFPFRGRLPSLIGGSRSPGGLPMESFAPTSMHSTILSELPARLIALCNRQCLRSGLNAVQQEDAVQLFVSALRRSRDPLPACGIIFSTTPPKVAVPSLNQVRAPNMDGQSTGAPHMDGQHGYAPNMDVASVAGDAAAGERNNAASPREGTPYMHGSGTSATLPEPGSVPRLTVVATPHANVDAASSACTRHLYELLSHLSDIRSLALTLMPVVSIDRLVEGHGLPPDSPIDLSKGGLASPPSHGSAALSNAAAAFAAAGGHSPSFAPARSLSPKEMSPRRGDVLVESGVPWERGRSQVPFGPFGTGGDSGRGMRSGSSPSPHQQQAGLMSPVSPMMTMAAGLTSIGSMQRPNLPTHFMVSQILRGIDQAAGIGEQVLKEVSVELTSLALHLHDTSKDRELWAHRFLAARELRYSSMLCEQAARIDQMDFAVPVAA